MKDSSYMSSVVHEIWKHTDLLRNNGMDVTGIGSSKTKNLIKIEINSKYLIIVSKYKLRKGHYSKMILINLVSTNGAIIINNDEIQVMLDRIVTINK